MSFCEPVWSPGELRFAYAGVAPVEKVAAEGIEKRLGGPPDWEGKSMPPSAERDGTRALTQIQGVAHGV